MLAVVGDDTDTLIVDSQSGEGKIVCDLFELVEQLIHAITQH